MDPFGLGLLCAFLIVTLGFGVYWRVVAFDRAWRLGASRLGLNYERSYFFKSPRIVGQIGACTVVIDINTPKHADHAMTRVRVRSPDLPLGFAVAPRSIWDKVSQRLFSRMTQVGDKRFDRTVKVDGDPAYALAVLAPEVRTRLQQLVGLEGGIEDRELTLVFRGRIRRPERLVQIVEFLVGLATDLVVTEAALPGALRARATLDPSAGIRMRGLRALVDKYPDSIETKRAIRDRLVDFVPEVRLLAARHSGAEGIDAAREVFDDPEVAPEVKAQALQVWSDLAPEPAPELRSRLAGALVLPALTLAGARLIARRKERDLRPALREVIDSGDEAGQAAAVAALGHVGTDEDLPLVVEKLEARDTDIRAAAAEAVGQLGGRDDVVHLLPLTRGLGQPTKVKEAARSAVNTIQKRMGGARGGLAVVEDRDSGALSVPLDGALSTPEE